MSEFIKQDTFEAIYKALPSGVLLLDQQGKVLSFNRQAAAFLNGLSCGAAFLELAFWQQGQTTAETAVAFASAANGEPAELVFSQSLDKAPQHWWLQFAALPADPAKILVQIQEISHFYQDQHKLGQQIEDLEHRNQELQQFAYIASHDLQEPLRKIRAFGERLQSFDGELSARGLSFLERMLNASARMQKMIQDLLNYSRLSAQSEHFEPVALEQVLDEVLDNLELKIEETRAEIRRHPLPKIRADRHQMLQLFQNLLENSLKFRHNEREPLIEISSSSSDKGVLLSLQDNGIGMEAQYHQEIFQPFKRLHPKDVYPGSGIGLAICQKIILCHQGSITVNSQLDQGTCFEISFPQPNPLENPPS